MCGSSSPSWQQNFWVQHIPWDYGVELYQEEDKIEMAFQPLPTADFMALVKVVYDETDKVPSKEEASLEPQPTFGSNPNIQVADLISKMK